VPTKDPGYDALCQKVDALEQELQLLYFTINSFKDKTKAFLSITADVTTKFSKLYDETSFVKGLADNDSKAAAAINALYKTQLEEYLLVNVIEQISHFQLRFPDLKKRRNERQRRLEEYDIYRGVVEEQRSNPKADATKLAAKEEKLRQTKDMYFDFHETLKKDLQYLIDHKSEDLQGSFIGLLNFRVTLHSENHNYLTVLKDQVDAIQSGMQTTVSVDLDQSLSMNSAASTNFNKFDGRDASNRRRELPTPVALKPSSVALKASSAVSSNAPLLSVDNDSSTRSTSSNNQPSSAVGRNTSPGNSPPASGLKNNNIRPPSPGLKNNNNNNNPTISPVPAPAANKTSPTAAAVGGKPNLAPTGGNNKNTLAAGSGPLVNLSLFNQVPMASTVTASMAPPPARGSDLNTSIFDFSSAPVQTMKAPMKTVNLAGTRASPLPESRRRRARADHDYTATDDSELSFKKGDIILIVGEDPSGWWDGELNGIAGQFPQTYVTVMS